MFFKDSISTMMRAGAHQVLIKPRLAFVIIKDQRKCQVKTPIHP